MQVWARLQHNIAHQPASSWVNHLRLDRVDERTAYLSPRPGHQDMLRFVVGSRRDRLAEMLSAAAGLPLKIELQAGSAAPADENPAPQNAPPRVDADQREALRALPLVKKLGELFDLTLLDVRTSDDKPSAPTPPQDDADDGIDADDP